MPAPYHQSGRFLPYFNGHRARRSPPQPSAAEREERAARQSATHGIEDRPEQLIAFATK
jgi:hypothetical protein